ncbi:MAG TPA: flavodoxin family protein [Clostridiaceae bacterium]
MKTLIIYASIHHGNTEKVGKAMAECLSADLKKANEVNTNILNDYDLIGFGSGIYGGKFHNNILEMFNKLPNLPNKKAFIFSTSGQGKTEYNNPIEQKLKEKGLKIVGSFGCKGFDTFGPLKLFGGIGKGRPNEEDLQKAKAFAENLIEK